jgi:hypothetical protein
MVPGRAARRRHVKLRRESMLEQCPTCGKTIGTLMESHPDKPGMIDILSGETTESHRIILTIALCVIAVLAVVATEALFR